MKTKTFSLACVTGIALALASSLTICSCGGSGSSMAKDAISKAETEVAVTKSTLFSEVGAIAQQAKSAKKTVNDAIKAERKKLNPKSESEAQAAMEKMEKLGEQGKAAEKEIKSYFNAKLAQLEAALVGKEVPCDFDKEVFSSVKVTIESFPDTTGLVMNATLTVADKYTKPYVSWVYLDAAGKEGSPLADYPNGLKGGVEAGGSFSLKLNDYVGNVDKLAKIYFKKP